MNNTEPNQPKQLKPHQRRRIARLIARSLALSERAKRIYEKSNVAIEKAVKLGGIGGKFELEDGRLFTVEDRFAESNTAFLAKPFSRYGVKKVSSKGGE